MTGEQIRIAIAEACGKPACVHHPDKWERRGPDGDSELYCTECSKYLHNMRTPNYPNDLNAMHEAENILDGPQLALMDWELEKVVERSGKSSHVRFHATARQRSEALLRTLGKWIESK